MTPVQAPQRHRLPAEDAWTSGKRWALLRQQNNPNFEPHFRIHSDPLCPSFRRTRRKFLNANGYALVQNGYAEVLPAASQGTSPDLRCLTDIYTRSKSAVKASDISTCAEIRDGVDTPQCQVRICNCGMESMGSGDKCQLSRW